jgi:site-specific recombinase XerD
VNATPHVQNTAHGRAEPRLQAALRLGPHHFAFMRALVQGIDRRQAFDRYLAGTAESTDERVIQSTTVSIRERLAAAASRETRPGMARLVRIDLRTIGAREGGSERDLPSIEDFARDEGLEDERFADQLKAYQERFGQAVDRQRRREKLVEKQLEALRWLERVACEPPAAGDGVASWLHPRLAAFLQNSDIFTLAQLAERVNGLGQRWHTGVKGIGSVKAARIVDWLKASATSTGLTIGSHSDVPRATVRSYELVRVVKPAADVRPLEKLVVPGELDGSRGAYRRPQQQCLLEAANDYDAVLAWLRSKRPLSIAKREALAARRRARGADAAPIATGSGLEWLAELSNTQRAYRKEAERLLIWAIVERKKPLSSLTTEDCTAYRDFLRDPVPRSKWCAPRSRQRWSPLWRPFEGPLSPQAQRQAVVILQNLWSFLVEQSYLFGNPWRGVAVARARPTKAMASRTLTMSQMAFVERQLDQLPDDSMSQRLAFAVRLLYATGLRISEVVAARTDDLQRVSYPAEGRDDEPLDGWMLQVVGKGDKVREVPVPNEVVEALGRYLASRGLPSDPIADTNRGVFLLGKSLEFRTTAPELTDRRFDWKDGLSALSLYEQLKGFFDACAAALRLQGDARGAERFSGASTHWLRHTHASHAVASEVPIQIVQQNLGHASLATVTLYVTSEEKKRLAAINTFWRGRHA